MRPRNTSVSVIVIIALLAITTLTLIVLGMVSYHYQRNRELDHVRIALVLDADQIAPSLALPLWNFDRPQINEIVESMMLDPTLKGMEVQAKEKGMVICARERNAQGKVTEVTGELSGDGALVEKRAIKFGNETIGMVTLFGTNQSADERMNGIVVWILENILWVDSVLFLGIYLLLRRWVLQPLQKVEAYAATVSTGEDAAQMGSFRGELESLRSSIETMVGQLKARYSQLQTETTERQQAEVALREKQAQLVLAMDISKLAHWEFDVPSNLVTGDEHIFQLFGTTSAREGGLSMSPEEYIRKFVHPADAGLVAQEVALGIAATDPHFAREFEHRMVRVDGTEGVMITRSRIVMDAAGRTRKILGTSQDITEQKRAEAALRQSEARFAQIFKSSPIPIIFSKLADGSILDVNEGFLQMSGFTREEVIGRTALELKVYPDPERRAFIMEQLHQHGHLHGYEQLLRMKSGEIRNQVMWFDVVSISGEQCVLIFALDVTERKKIEAQFLRVQRMESIGTLASGVAHDLNNILSPIMMSVPILRLEMTPEEREGIIATIELSAERGAQIVKQVLTFGRGLEGEKRPLQVERQIQEMMKIMRATFPKDITVESAMGPGLWTVLGDATQLHQVLLNLCVNARDAMPDGGRLRLRADNLDIDASYASMLPESAPGPHVLLEVSDTGSGIPPEILERIFDPFFTTKEIGKGTGLGLSTVHGIVKNHGGFIKVVSERGKGTTFQVYLPAAVKQEGAPAAASPEGPPTGHGELVLMVDDEPAITNAARTFLEAHGYRLLLATDGAEALTVFAQNSKRIALVLTDVMMPHLDGIGLIRTLRKMRPGIPVIASTGLGEKKRLAELKEMGIETVLHKPYNADALLRTVHGALNAAADGLRKVR